MFFCFYFVLFGLWMARLQNFEKEHEREQIVMVKHARIE